MLAGFAITIVQINLVEDSIYKLQLIFTHLAYAFKFFVHACTYTQHGHLYMCDSGCHTNRSPQQKILITSLAKPFACTPVISRSRDCYSTGIHNKFPIQKWHSLSLLIGSWQGNNQAKYELGLKVPSMVQVSCSRSLQLGS